LQALGNPQERTHRIAERRRLYNTQKRIAEARMLIAKRMSAPAFAAHPSCRHRRAVEIILAPIDRRARKPRDLGNQRQPAAAGGAYFRRSK